MIRLTRQLVEILLNLQFLASNAVGLVPVHLDAMNCTIFKADGGNTFQLASAPRAESLAQAGKLVYLATDGNRYDFFDLADSLKVFSHPLIPALQLTIPIQSGVRPPGDEPRHK